MEKGCKLEVGSLGTRDLKMGCLVAFGELRARLVGKGVGIVWRCYRPTQDPRTEISDPSRSC